MGLTNFPFGITSFGIPVLGGGSIPSTFGNYWFVDYDNGSDGFDGKSPAKAFKTVQKAVDSATTNNNDVICLSAYSNHALTKMLTVSKNRLHFVGVDGAGRMYGQGAKISLGVTTATTDVAVMLNTGVRNSFHNIKFSNDNTLAQCLSTVAEGGEYAMYSNCEFYRSTLLNGATSCELLLNGDSAQFYNCTFGSLADSVVGDIIHPCVRLAKGVAGTGLVTRDARFQDCQFWRNAGGTTCKFVYAAGGTDVERLLLFKNCEFIANNLGSTPAAAVGAGALQTSGKILLKNCTSMGCTILAQAAVGIYVDGAVPTFATSGVSVAA
jgi:hypothetical protein